MEKEKKCECKVGAPAYMMTFGDLMSLLLTFFVMLLSMASFEPVKYAMTVQSLQGAFGVLESFPTIAIMPIVRIPKMSKDDDQKKESQNDVEKLKKALNEKSTGEGIKVKVTETGIAIMLSDPMTFAVGSDDLNPKTNESLKEIAKIIDRRSDAKIRVEGHTDDVPIHTKRFPSNWELSSARALKIVRSLSNYSKVDPGSYSAVGYGEHKPLLPNINKENREKNRRIEIYIDYTKKEK